MTSISDVFHIIVNCHRELSEDEFEEFDDENLNDVESYDEKRSSFGLPSVTSYQRDPNSAMQRSFKNEEGYYLIEGAGHTVKGTKNFSICNTNGVFSVGKIGGKNFIKSPTGWYLAIDSSGNVYMKKNRDSDTGYQDQVVGPSSRGALPENHQPYPSIFSEYFPTERNHQ